MKELQASDASMLARIAETIEKRTIEQRTIDTSELVLFTDRLQSPEARSIANAMAHPGTPGIQQDIRETAEAIRNWAHTNFFVS